MLLNCGFEESPLDCKEIKPVNPKGNQSWILTGRTDVEAETPILWPPDVKNWLIGKDCDAGKDWRQEKGMTEDEMVAWPPTGWTWVWASSRSWWWTGKPCALQSMGSLRVGHDWVTELNWLDAVSGNYVCFFFGGMWHFSFQLLSRTVWQRCALSSCLFNLVCMHTAYYSLYCVPPPKR